jgi:hypothetical protein
LLNGEFYLPANATLKSENFQKDSFETILYPNPSSGNFTIMAPFESEIKIIDAQGKIVVDQKMNSNSMQLNLKNQATGLYMIHIKNGNNVEIKKLILN